MVANADTAFACGLNLQIGCKDRVDADETLF